MSSGHRVHEGDANLTALAECDAAIRRCEDEPGEVERLSRVLIDKGDTLLRLQRFTDAAESYGRAATALRDSSGAPEMGAALVKEGMALMLAGHFAEADATFDVWRAWANARPNAESAVARLHVQIAKLYHRDVRALFDAGRFGESVLVADAFLERYFVDPPPERRDLVAHGAYLRGVSLSRSGRSSQAIDQVDALVEAYGQDDVPEVEAVVAAGLDLRAKLFLADERREEALDDWRRVLCGATQTGPNGDALAYSALQGEFFALRGLEWFEDAVEVADEIVRRFGVTPPEGVPFAAVAAEVEKAWILAEHGRPQLAIVIVDEMWAQVAEKRREPGLDVILARSICVKAMALSALQRWTEALSVSEGMLTSFSDGSADDLTEPMARAMLQRGLALKELGRGEDAIHAWADLSSQYGGEDQNEAVRALVGRAFAERAELLALHGRFAEALPIAESMIDRASMESGEAQLRLLAGGLAVRATALLGRHDFEEALASLDSLVATLGEPGTVELRGQLALALHNKSATLRQLGREEQADETYGEAVRRFGQELLMALEEHLRHAVAAGSVASDQLASVLYSLARVRTDLGQPSAAARAVDELAVLSEHDGNAYIRALVTSARQIHTASD